MPEKLLDPIQSPAPVAPSFRAWNDFSSVRNAFYNNAMEGIKERFSNLENNTHRLELDELKYDDKLPTLADETEAINSRHDLSRKLYGKYRLLNKTTGTVVAERPALVANIPHVTKRGTFIRNGHEYILFNQQRLKPGVYTRQKKDGDYETQFNILPGSGRGFRMNLEKESGLFKFQIGQGSVRAYPVFRALGYSDEMLKSIWGEDLWRRNSASKSSGKEVVKFASELAHAKDLVDEKNAAQKLPEIFARMKLDKIVTKRTLGKAFDTLSPEALLAANRKLLQVYRGEVSPDERDASDFQSFHSAEDYIKDNFKKDAASAARKLLWKASFNNNLDAIPQAALTDTVSRLFNETRLGAMITQVNPLEILDLHNKITRMGEGGIGDQRAISKDARGVQPTHLGIMDPLRAPECFDASTEVMTDSGWKPWPLVTKETKLACLINGRLEFNIPESLFAAPYKGIMYGAKNTHIDYLVTPNHRVYSRYKGNLRSGKLTNYNIRTAEQVHNKHRLVKSSGHIPYEPLEPQLEFTLPEVDICSNAQNRAVGPIDMELWLDFLGWYLSEGSVYYSEDKCKYSTEISQSKIANPENVKYITALLTKLPFAFSYSEEAGKFTIAGKQLATYLKQFGKSDTKYLPDYVFNASAAARQKLFASLLLGDGRTSRFGDKRTYCTGSAQLAKDFEKLCFSLGKSSKLSTYVDNRKESYLNVNEIYIHTRTERELCAKPARRSVSDYYVVEDYDSMVYCATVPGNLLYVRRNGCLGFWSGNSQAIGLDQRIAYRTYKGADGQVYTEVRDPKTGEDKTVSASAVVNSTVAFPGEMASDKKFVVAMANGKVQLVDRKKVNFEIPYGEDMFSPLTNMIPLMAHAKGQRMLMGARMATQAVSLADPEARLVQSKDTRTGRSFDELFSSELGAVYADKPGVIKEVSADKIAVQNEDGTESNYEIYNNFPFNTKGFLHNTTSLTPGVKIGKGQLLARSNFTDASGRAAYGKNLNVAFHPYNQYTHDDGIVVSENCAKKMASEQMYKHKLDKFDNVDDVDFKRYVSLFPDRFKREQLQNIDPDTGIVRVGSVVNPGDPLILGIGKTNDQTLSAIMKHKKNFFNDAADTWEYKNPGVVTDARKSRGGWQVIVKAKTPISEGDKLANSYGGKGVVSKVVPDEQMPTNEAGEPIDIIVSPAGLVSRVNPAQIIESMLGKVAKKTGVPYVLNTFNNKDMMQFAIDEMKKHGISDTETIYDPVTGRNIPKVFTGNMYFMRLYHMAEDKISARNTGLYGSDFSPAKGGDEMQQSKRLGNLDINALVTHGATEVLKDRMVRAQQNDDYWRMFRMGYEPPTPKVYEPYERFINYVRGSGAQIVKDGSKTHLFPMTDKAVDELAKDELTSADTVNFNTNEPIPGGLFDVQKTGGKGGHKWSYIRLDKPIPNPAIETPIRSLLGLTGPEYRDVIAGKKSLGAFTGVEALNYSLNKINVQEQIKQNQDIVANSRGDKRDKAVKKLRLLGVLDRYNMKPSELMISKIPVLPPKYRPIAMMGGTQLVSDPNYLYKEVFEANKNIGQSSAELGNSAANEDTITLYDSVKGLFGIGEPVNVKNQERNVRGLLRDFVGKGSPKGGSWQRRVIGGTLDTVGRSVIIPDPTLGMDEVSIPNKMAWTLFEPFVMRNLVKSGVPAVAAKKAIEEQNPMALKVLDKIMQERPVMLNRAPTLHKHNITGHFAKRHNGDAIKVPLATLTGWNADFDGDAMNVHVPVSDDAVRDVVSKMMPSKNLLSAKTMSIHMKPEQMALLGLYRATAPADPSKAPVKFATEAEAMAAYSRGEIGPNDPVLITG